MTTTIYHNPKCGTSRSVLQILREAGVEPEIVEYLKTPLSRAALADLAGRLGGAARLLREKEPLAAELGLKGAAAETILDAIAQHPILFNRPVVVTPKGARVCRPAELARELL
ncbi:arsenate reductase (glutaredoxin) [Acidocella sp.]|uniref:arsenate reductase (glutaredoxin) n=1 Tax=Acidocella sp. TaxID=50710 RepID=UPI003D031FD7